MQNFGVKLTFKLSSRKRCLTIIKLVKCSLCAPVTGVKCEHLITQSLHLNLQVTSLQSNEIFEVQHEAFASS